MMECVGEVRNICFSVKCIVSSNRGGTSIKILGGGRAKGKEKI